jgi:hypothetical protein
MLCSLSTALVNCGHSVSGPAHLHLCLSCLPSRVPAVDVAQAFFFRLFLADLPEPLGVPYNLADLVF